MLGPEFFGGRDAFLDAQHMGIEVVFTNHYAFFRQGLPDGIDRSPRPIGGGEEDDLIDHLFGERFDILAQGFVHDVRVRGAP